MKILVILMINIRSQKLNKWVITPSDKSPARKRKKEEKKEEDEFIDLTDPNPVSNNFTHPVVIHSSAKRVGKSKGGKLRKILSWFLSSLLWRWLVKENKLDREEEKPWLNGK